MASSNTKRFRVSVPETDEVVIAWLNNQESVSASLRAIIKEAVRRHGIADVFSSKLPEDMAAMSASPTVRPKTARSRPPAKDVPKVAKARSRAPAADLGPGISLGDDALSEFGIELDLGTFGGGGDDDAVGDISEMMGKG